MTDGEIMAALYRLEPPRDLFEQMEKQGDCEKTEPVMVYKKISRKEAWCAELLERRITTFDAPAVLWCSECEQLSVVGWQRESEAPAGCSRGMMRPPRSGVLMMGGGSDYGEPVLWDGDMGYCPLCGERARLRHRSWLGTGRAKQLIATVPYRVGDALFLLRWWMEERLEPAGLGCRWRRVSHPEKAWVLDGDTVQQWRKMRKVYVSTYEELPCWEKQRRAADGMGIPYFYTKDPPRLDGTWMENSKLWEWMRDTYDKNLFAPLAYLRLYRKHPNTEVLVTAGCGRLLGRWLQDECELPVGVYSSATRWKAPALAWVRWKERRPSAMLGLDRGQLRDCLGADTTDAVRILYIRFGRAAGLSMEECVVLNKAAAEPVSAIDALKARKADLHKAIRYLKREKANWNTLQDYWNMQKRLGVDVQADLALEWPKRLQAAHDRVQSAVRYKIDEKKETEFAAMTARLQGLCWEHDGICIRPAASIRELVAEGETLHHCVGGYGTAHCSGKCIFFIRHARRPERSWFTLQVNVHTRQVLQNHGYRNEFVHGRRRHIPKEVTEFVEAWKREVLAAWRLPAEKKTKGKAA